jgi:hypothetical protein
MAGANYLPTREDALSLWAQNFSTLVTAGPILLGLLAGDATALATLVTAYTTTLATSTNPTTRTPTSVMLKNTAKAQLIADIRALVKRIQATLTVTAGQKVSLGITVPDHVRTPVAPPATKPLIAMMNLESLGFSLRLTDEATPAKRSKPVGVDGADVYTFVAAAGTTPPADVLAWNYQGRAQKADYNVSFPMSQVGMIAHIRAKWVTARGLSGPVSDELARTIAA